jgi:hypothetical protein
VKFVLVPLKKIYAFLRWWQTWALGDKWLWNEQHLSFPLVHLEGWYLDLLDGTMSKEEVSLFEECKQKIEA